MKSQRVTVMGLGLHGGGLSVVQWFLRHGAHVTVTDLKTKKELAVSVRQLHVKGQLSGVRCIFGYHRKKDFIKADMVVRNPAVPIESPFLKIARTHDVPIENEATLFFQQCRSKNIIGVTGTRGKSTTAAMIAAILQRNKKATKQKSNVWLAGNIRTTPMLSIVDRIKPNDWVVLELSSWHLEDMYPVRSRSPQGGRSRAFGGAASNGVNRQKISPHVAVVTNVLEDHLNRYASMRSYARAKEAIVRYQKESDIAVLNRENPWTEAMAKKTKADVYWFTNDKLGIRNYEKRGEHFVLNAQAAATTARAIGIPLRSIRSALQSFKGLPDRQEILSGSAGRGVTYVNDTTATTPDATIAALRTFSMKQRSNETTKQIILIAGGSDKNLNYKPLIPWIQRTCKAVVLLPGTATEKIKKYLSPITYHLSPVHSMSSAVRTAARLATKSDIVLLSPAAASFGLFQHEFDRGQQFRKVVRQLK